VGDNVFSEVDYGSGCCEGDVEAFGSEALDGGETVLALHCNLAKSSADGAPGITNGTFEGRGWLLVFLPESFAEGLHALVEFEVFGVNLIGAVRWATPEAGSRSYRSGGICKSASLPDVRLTGLGRKIGEVMRLSLRTILISLCFLRS